MLHLQLRQALRRGEIDDVEVLQVKHLTPSDGKAYLAKWKHAEPADDKPDQSKYRTTSPTTPNSRPRTKKSRILMGAHMSACDGVCSGEVV
jgi:hypothetical protein